MIGCGNHKSGRQSCEQTRSHLQQVASADYMRLTRWLFGTLLHNTKRGCGRNWVCDILHNIAWLFGLQKHSTRALESEATAVDVLTPHSDDSHHLSAYKFLCCNVVYAGRTTSVYSLKSQGHIIMAE